MLHPLSLSLFPSVFVHSRNGLPAWRRRQRGSCRWLLRPSRPAEGERGRLDRRKDVDGEEREEKMRAGTATRWTAVNQLGRAVKAPAADPYVAPFIDKCHSQTMSLDVWMYMYMHTAAAAVLRPSLSDVYTRAKRLQRPGDDDDGRERWRRRN